MDIKASDQITLATVDLDGMDDKITDAAKTATNFLSYDATNGLQIGKKTSNSWSGYRTQVKSDSFNILDEQGSAVSSFGANGVMLGNNNDESIISMCNGRANIKYNTQGDQLGFSEINADKIYYNASNHKMYASGLAVIPSTTDGEWPYWLTSSELNISGSEQIVSMISRTRMAEADGTPTGTVRASSDVSVFPTKVEISSNTINLTSDNISANGYEVLTSADVESGSWTPVCSSISSPSQAIGSYTKIGKNVTVSFCIYGPSSSSSTNSYSLRITGLPYTPDTSVRWFAGGGNISGVNTDANYAFAGYCIENNTSYGPIILPRCVSVGTSSGTRSSQYCRNVNGGTIYMSGTLMYRTA